MYRPSVFPFNRHKVWNAPYRSEITKQVSKPVTVRCINDSTLGNSKILKSHPAFIGSGYAFSPVYNNRTHATPGPGYVVQVILSVNFKKLRSLGTQHDIIACRGTCIFNKNPVS